MGSQRQALAWALAVRRGKDEGSDRLFFVEGMKAARDALAAGVRVRQAFAGEEAFAGAAGEALRDALRQAGVPVEAVGTRDIERLSHTRTPQGIVLLAERPAQDAGGMLAAGRATVVYLDTVQDPGNVGAIVRAALALGATHVVAGGASADPFSPKAARAAAGAELRLPIVRDPDGSLAARLRDAGFHIVAADAHGGTAPAPGGPAAARRVLVLGSEGHGVSPSLLALAHERIRIPLARAAESLNVAQAAAVLLFSWNQDP